MRLFKWNQIKNFKKYLKGIDTDDFVDISFILVFDRFELSNHYYISYWKLFWQISYRKDTL